MKVESVNKDFNMERLMLTHTVIVC